ncbi:3'-tRNA processing endoribonuclease [Aureococcus anophagefferens]|uniref:3'-tRNA processing endoribonuclease n=1 Tax=Aureococcus anophagefferens TaxID=44056 RepID=A0ABR1FVC6_AURAN
MEVVALGTSAGAPTRERNVQACYVRLEDGSFVVFDCGEGTQHRLLEAGAKARGPRRFRAGRVAAVCVTHLHGDHAFGLPGLLCYLDANGGAGAGPVELTGFPAAAPGARGEACEAPAAAVAGALAGVVCCDEVARAAAAAVDGTWHNIITIPGATLRAAALDHGAIPCVGYRLEERPRPGVVDAAAVAAARRRWLEPAVFGALGRAALAGLPSVALADGAQGEAPAPLAVALRGADVVLHEATLDDLAALAHDRGHSTPGDAGRLAAAARAATLALWHFSPRYKPGDLAAFADAARAHFGGTVVIASDLLAIPVARRT